MTDDDGRRRADPGSDADDGRREPGSAADDERPSRRPGEPTDVPPADEGPGGIFPSWGSLYGTVLVWFVLTIVVLYVLTVTLDVGPP